MRFQQFDFVIQHRKGKANVVSDFLSRDSEAKTSLIQVVNDVRDRWYLRLIGMVCADPDERVLEKFHDVPMAGHFGNFKTCCKIMETYYWTKLRTDTGQLVYCALLGLSETKT